MKLSFPANCGPRVKHVAVLYMFDQQTAQNGGKDVKEQTLKMIDEVSREWDVLEAISRQHKSAADAKAVHK